MSNRVTQLFLIPTLLFISVFTSCERQVIPFEEVELGMEYFPTTIGHEIIYDVDSIIYNDFALRTDTFRMQFKDIIVDTFFDNENRLSHKVQRFIRPDDTFPWSELSTHYFTSNKFKIEQVENNLRFIKMVFPVVPNTRWNGNVYIPAAQNAELQWYVDWDYRYRDINQPYFNGVTNWSNTVTVTQADRIEGAPDSPNDYSARTFSKEVYAKNKGLIYRELTRWVYEPQIKYRKGFTLIMKAIN
jgi:hypothetical protein